MFLQKAVIAYKDIFKFYKIETYANKVILSNYKQLKY